MTKRVLALLVWLVLGSLLLSVSMVPSVGASPTYEDFTVYTEVDPNTHIAVVNASYINFTAYMNEDAYVYTDGGSNHFSGAFEHNLDINMQTKSASFSARATLWALTNNVDDLSNINGDFLCMYIYNASYASSLYILEHYDGSSYTNNTAINMTTWYYLIIDRVSTTFRCRMYTNSSQRDAEGTPDTTLTLSLQSAVSYQYIFASVTWNTGGAGSFTATIQNLDLHYTYEYTFYGLYDEATGDRNGAVNVTARYQGAHGVTTFEVDDSYVYGTYDKPQYFVFDLVNDREYWLSTSEDSGSIYIFEASTTVYTVQFVDLAGILGSYSLISARRYINGTLHTVEKRKADLNDRVEMALIQGTRYNIYIQDDIEYNYGDELFSTDTDVTITIRGIEFPQEIILAYQYVRIYAERHNNYSSISLLYQDLETDTDYVDCYIKYRNGTIAYNITKTGVNLFNQTWASAQYNITYYVEMDVFHNDFGELNYRAVMYRGGFGISPFGLDWLGTIPYMLTSVIIPSFLILGAGGLFSKVNAYVGAFMATIVAILLAWWGWIEIAPAMLIIALALSILMGLAYKKRRVYGA